MKFKLPLPSLMIAETQKSALVSIVIVIDNPFRIHTRKAVGPAEAVGEPIAASRELPGGVAAPFRHGRETRRKLAAAADHVDDAGHSIGAVKRTLRSADNFDALQAL